MDLDQEVLKAAVNVMSITDETILPNFEAAISKVNHDGLDHSVWANRGQVLTDIFADHSIIKIRHVKRGTIWQFEAMVNVENHTVYLLMTHDNLRKLQREFKKNKHRTHYLFSLLRLNPESICVQQELFAFDEESFKAAREMDCDNILGEFAGQIEHVQVLAFDYANHSAIGGAVYLLDQSGATIEREDISDMLLDQDKTSENDSLGTEPVQRTTESTPLVKLKIKKA
ncbi:DUF5986 family protein [Lapidilactobacillus achengensis]|uniref:DUF5986 family protein n=1 Tax=Lapidilactobacillus achengensis TaxID=2486000 RepID=A0ABW1US13_9LACO|nr:DUF5986 family protein [Lapidilactobacillus achengensis]